jgi:hypothetical protein
MRSSSLAPAAYLDRFYDTGGEHWQTVPSRGDDSPPHRNSCRKRRRPSG